MICNWVTTYANYVAKTIECLRLFSDSFDLLTMLNRQTLENSGFLYQIVDCIICRELPRVYDIKLILHLVRTISNTYIIKVSSTQFNQKYNQLNIFYEKKAKEVKILKFEWRKAENSKTKKYQNRKFDIKQQLKVKNKIGINRLTIF